MACNLGLVVCRHNFHSAKRAFSVWNLIKTKVGNRLGSKNLDTKLRIALEGQHEEVDDIIGDAIPLWKKDSLYHFCILIPFLIWILLI